MKLSLVEERDFIEKIQEDFRKKLESELLTSLECTIGFPSGSWQTEVIHNNGFWFNGDLIDEENKSARYWNGFGLSSDLDSSKSNNIVIEINIPLSGINRRVSGAFATDENGKRYLLHRGRVGGGRKGIGKQAFLNWSERTPTSVVSSKSVDEFIVLGCIDDKGFSNKLLQFIKDIKLFKHYATSTKGAAPQFLSLEELEQLIGSQDDNVQLDEVVNSQYSRSSLVKEHARRRANGICQLCANKAPFLDNYGKPFLEVHHIEWLSRGGEDSIKNTIGLCPNCHRKMHIVDEIDDVERLARAVELP